MDLQKFVEGIDASASIYSFDILEDGSFSEIRISAANDGFKAFFALNRASPKFEPGLPYRLFFNDPNFESFCYRCASTREPLFSYVNAHGSWLTGIYFAVNSDDDDKKTVHCCYILKISAELESEKMSGRSAGIANAVLDMNIKLNKEQDFIKAVSGAVKDIKAICSSQLCSIVLVDKNKEECILVSESGRNDESLRSLADSMGRTPYQVALAWESDLAGSDCLLLEDLSVVKERDPEWYSSLKDHNIDSIVLYAVKFNDELVGFIWAANFDVASIMRIKETMELSTFFIGAVIANHQLLGKLETMSMYDMLTDVLNRNAMNKRTDGLVSGRPETLGVVFTDLNGLKEVNDNLGHNEGDKLLKKAALLIRTTFGDSEVYRAGGDEFVILCPDISKEDFDRRINELRSIMEQTQDVNLAIGSQFFEGEYDIRRAMQLADECMYEDKQRFYNEHPEKRRRLSDD